MRHNRHPGLDPGSAFFRGGWKKRWIPAFAGMTMAFAAPVHAQTNTAADYTRDSNWLCLPGRNDACSTALPTTDLNAGGYGAKGLSPVAKDPPIDCFYVYPTVSSDPGMNSDLNPGPRGEACRRNPVRALRFGVPAFRADLPADDAWRRGRLFGRGEHRCGGDARLSRTCSPPGATILRRGTRDARSCSSATARAA